MEKKPRDGYVRSSCSKTTLFSTSGSVQCAVVSFANGACGKNLACSSVVLWIQRSQRVFHVFSNRLEKNIFYTFCREDVWKRRKRRIRYSLTFPHVFRVNIISKYWSWRIVPFLWSIFFDIYLVSFYPIKYLISCYTLIFNLNQIYVPFSRKIIICYAKFFFFL